MQVTLQPVLETQLVMSLQRGPLFVQMEYFATKLSKVHRALFSLLPHSTIVNRDSLKLSGLGPRRPWATDPAIARLRPPDAHRDELAGGTR